MSMIDTTLDILTRITVLVKQLLGNSVVVAMTLAVWGQYD
jgi:hypothetical protein